MALGIVLHAALFLVDGPWAVHDPYARATPPGDNPYSFLLLAIHGFRMPLFFMLSGFFSAMTWQRRGWRYLARQRLRRIGLPLALGALTIIPLNHLLFSADDFQLPFWPVSWLYDLSHLWFLWQLLLLVALFLLAIRMGAGFQGNLWWLLLPAPVLPTLFMTEATFGPDTNSGLLPGLQVLTYYGIFFFFGAFLYRRSIGIPGRLALALLPALVLVFPVGLSFTFDERQTEWPPLAAALLQVGYTWLMCFGLMGLFRLLLSRAHPRVRYLSDASYWLYLTHLSLVLALQHLLAGQPGNPHLKFVVIVVLVSAVLLVCYRLFVRYTWIGTMLNGKRERPVTSSH